MVLIVLGSLMLATIRPFAPQAQARTSWRHSLQMREAQSLGPVHGDRSPSPGLVRRPTTGATGASLAGGWKTMSVAAFFFF